MPSAGPALTDCALIARRSSAARLWGGIAPRIVLLMSEVSLTSCSLKLWSRRLHGVSIQRCCMHPRNASACRQLRTTHALDLGEEALRVILNVHHLPICLQICLESPNSESLFPLYLIELHSHTAAVVL